MSVAEWIPTKPFPSLINSSITSCCFKFRISPEVFKNIIELIFSRFLAVIESELFDEYTLNLFSFPNCLIKSRPAFIDLCLKPFVSVITRTENLLSSEQFKQSKSFLGRNKRNGINTINSLITSILMINYIGMKQV